MRDETAQERDEARPRAAVKVLARWNSWVQVWNPATDEVRWVDLDDTPYAPTRAPSDAQD